MLAPTLGNEYSYHIRGLGYVPAHYTCLRWDFRVRACVGTLGFRFWVLGFGFGFGFWVLGLNFQHLNFQHLNFQHLNFQHLNFQHLNFPNISILTS